MHQSVQPLSAHLLSRGDRNMPTPMEEYLFDLHGYTVIKGATRSRSPPRYERFS